MLVRKVRIRGKYQVDCQRFTHGSESMQGPKSSDLVMFEIAKKGFKVRSLFCVRRPQAQSKENIQKAQPFDYQVPVLAYSEELDVVVSIFAGQGLDYAIKLEKGGFPRLDLHKLEPDQVLAN